MKDLFSKQFVRFLCKELDLDQTELRDVIEKYFKVSKSNDDMTSSESSVEEVKPKSKKSKTKSVKSTKKTKNVSDEKHTCERIPRGKSEPCGKNAKNEIEGLDGKLHWYCGTQKGGCLKSIMGAIYRVKNKDVSKTTTKKVVNAKKPTTNVGRKKVSDIKSKSLVHSVAKTQTLSCKKIRVGGKKLYFDPQTRIMIDRKTKEAYGKLSDDGETILQLNDKDVRFCNTSNVKIRKGSVEKKAKKTKSTKKKESIESSESDDSIDSDLLSSDSDSNDSDLLDSDDTDLLDSDDSDEIDLSDSDE